MFECTAIIGDVELTMNDEVACTGVVKGQGLIKLYA